MVMLLCHCGYPGGEAEDPSYVSWGEMEGFYLGKSHSNGFSVEMSISRNPRYTDKSNTCIYFTSLQNSTKMTIKG